MPRQKSNLLYTAIQAVVGIGVAAGAVWLGTRLYGYYTAQHTYSEMGEKYITSAAPAQVEDKAPTEAETFKLDFTALTADYPEAVAWLQMDDLPQISYPVMHHADNDFYLHHAPDGSYAAGGSIFMDCNNAAITDTHVLLYGHAMQDGSMFAALYDYRDEDFYRSGTGCFTLATANGSQRYQIFAVQVVEADDEIYSVGFEHSELFAQFLQNIKAGALYDTGVEVTAADQVVTLSTCATYSGQGRLVISAKALNAA